MLKTLPLLLVLSSTASGIDVELQDLNPSFD